MKKQYSGFIRKTLLGICTLFSIASAHAQLSEGGLPLSYQLQLNDSYCPTSSYALPDWDAFLKKSDAEESAGKPQPFMVALFVQTQVSFPGSGVMTRQQDGRRIWRTRISIPQAKAIGLYFNDFHLPKGVRLFITNANGNQVLGAYSCSNTPASGKFANEAVQGDKVMIELDIDAGADADAIRMDIDRAAVYFRGTEYLAHYAVDPADWHLIDANDTAFTGKSSVCMINSICPQGELYANQRKATLQTLIPTGQGVGGCSATMINNTGNDASSCKQYFLTASHCDDENGTTSSHFDQMILRYNFEQATCMPGNAIPQSNSIVGANFVSRSVYDQMALTDDTKGDFLLLEARQPIPQSWNVVLAGWNKEATPTFTTTLPKKFSGFHHPEADVKKLSTTQEIGPAMFNPNLPEEDAVFWGLYTEEGYVSVGSSGSGLFDPDGHLIGCASMAFGDNMPQECLLNAAGQQVNRTSNVVIYSKFTYDWDYSIDGTAATSKLKPWLDPANTGVIKLNPLKSNCTTVDNGTGISIDNRQDLENAVTVFPNPSLNGMVQLNFNLAKQANINMALYDINGKKLRSYDLKNIQSGTYKMDLANLPNGVYMLMGSDGNNAFSKKIMLTQ